MQVKRNAIVARGVEEAYGFIHDIVEVQYHGHPDNSGTATQGLPPGLHWLLGNARQSTTDGKGNCGDG